MLTCICFFFYYEEVKSYWTTDRSHFKSFKYRRSAETSELYSRSTSRSTSQVHQHFTALFQCTQITNGEPNTHIQRGKRINETMSFQPESFTVSNQVVQHLIITFTLASDLQLFQIYQDAIEQSNVQIKPLTQTQCKQTFSLPFDPQTRAEVSHLEK
jgi:hypothetical protein